MRSEGTRRTRGTRELRSWGAIQNSIHPTPYTLHPIHHTPLTTP
ncbi:MAG: hypothetical protein ACRC32_27355 [Chroococcidiopsis sp.]